MPDERAFTRREPGTNPIALELDRLAEQQSLKSLGRGRVTADPTAATDARADATKAAYSNLLDRIRTAPGREGETDVLSQVPDDELAQHAKMANDEIDQAIAAGNAHVDEKGDLYGDEGPSLSPHLTIIHEHEAREAAQPTKDDPTIGTQDLGRSIGDEIGEAKNMVDQRAFRSAFGLR
jgi:hypothetical protein